MATDTTVTAEAPAPHGDPAGPERTTRLPMGVLVPVVLLLVAATLRFYGLGYPTRIFFDETYYAPQGREMLIAGVEEGFAVHPPVGKWMIAAGIDAFGYDSFGFRAGAAAAGTVVVMLTYLVGLRLFRRRGVAALAALFVAIDGLALTMSRIAMLDIFLAMFVMAGVLFLLLDRDMMWRGLTVPAEPGGPLPRRPHLWRWLAGLAFGLALATKWSALLAIGGAGLFVGINEILWRRAIAGSVGVRAFWQRWWRPVISALATLVVVPVVVYVLSYAGWFANFESTRLGIDQCPNGVCTISSVEIVKEWWGEQRQIAHFHRTLEAEHPYRSAPSTWPYLGRPVAYYYESCNDDKLAKGECVTEQGHVEEILGVGNPAIWWLGLPAFAITLFFGAWKRDWRALTILGFYAVQYVPWLFIPRPNFLFYLTPAVPFLCLSLTYAVWRLGHNTFLRWLPGAVALVAVVAFLFWYPLWTGIEMPLSSWQLRIWMRSWI